MRSNILLLSLFFLPFAALADSSPFSPIDSTKYRGYRLELTNFKKLKAKSDWVKISFTIVNTGKMNVDMGRKGTEHWVIFNFDKSIFEAKLGGYRENIKTQLAKEGFRLDTGNMIVEMELKISTVMPTPPPQRIIDAEPVLESPTTDNIQDDAISSISWQANLPSDPPPPAVELNEKGAVEEASHCPDILFSDLKIIKQDDKYATLQYTLSNQGKGVYYLFGQNGSPAVNAFLSGVTTLTRGALPIGRQELTDEIRSNNELKEGESVTAQIRIDIRQKTRYMKSLILSIEGPQFALECDRTNNSMGVVLD